MASTDAKVSKKRRQDGEPEAAKRKQKKQKKAALSAEFIPPSSPEPGMEGADGIEPPKADVDFTPTKSTSPKKKKLKTEKLPPAETNGHALTPADDDTPEKPKKTKKAKKDSSASKSAASIAAPSSSSKGLAALSPPPTAPETKPKKSKKRDGESSQASVGAAPLPSIMPSLPERLASKRDNPEARRKKRKDADRTSAPPSEPPPPVVMQEIARWVPLWPRGWHQPITAAIEQHFTPSLHRYDSEVGGVLLGYKNVCLNDRPTRKGAATEDHEAVKLLSVDEYGVGFCWLIADLELFLPKRGSWMEGELILQNQGHIGVVCWDKFNASIEANRLPPKWIWVAAPDEDYDNVDYNMDVDVDGQEGDEDASATPLGHWIDELGNKVQGKLRFRIKNYDVGLSGDHSFLCIEGTLLDEQEENRLREKELKTVGRAGGGGSRRVLRVLPEFSMTDLGVDEEEDRSKTWGKREPKEDRRPKYVEDDVDAEAAVEAEAEAEATEEVAEMVAEAVDDVESDD